MGLVDVDLNISLGDDKFDDDDPENIIYIRLMAWCNRYKQRKACKKNKQRIHTSSMESNKIVRLVHVRR